MKSALHSTKAKDELNAYLAKEFQAPPVGTGKVHTSHRKSYKKLKAKVVRPYAELNSTEKALYDLVYNLVTSEPFDAVKRKWAARPQEYYAQAIGISADHVRRVANAIPLRSLSMIVNERKTTLLRVAPPSDLTNEDFARIMKSEWLKRFDGTVGSKEYGCLVGIAISSPIGYAPDVFCTVLDNWSEFSAYYKSAIFMAKNGEGDEFDANPEHFVERYLQNPQITTIRRFWYVAKDFYNDMAQKENFPVLPG